jgi:hypothetical protein
VFERVAAKSPAFVIFVQPVVLHEFADVDVPCVALGGVCDAAGMA